MIPVFLDSARKHKNLARTYKNWLPDVSVTPAPPSATATNVGIATPALTTQAPLVDTPMMATGPAVSTPECGLDSSVSASTPAVTGNSMAATSSVSTSAAAAAAMSDDSIADSTLAFDSNAGSLVETAATLKVVVADFMANEASDPACSAIPCPNALIAVAKYLNSRMPNTRADGTLLVSGRSEKMMKRIAWWKANFASGTFEFTVPNDNRDGTSIPDPEYHAIEGAKLYMVRWEIAFPRVLLLCPEDGCSGRLKAERMNMNKPATYTQIVELGNPLIYAVACSYKCSACGSVVRANHGKLLHQQPNFVQGAYPVDPRYAIAERSNPYQFGEKFTQQFDSLSVTTMPSSIMTKQAYVSYGQFYEKKVLDYYSQLDWGSKQKPPLFIGAPRQYPNFLEFCGGKITLPSSNTLLEAALLAFHSALVPSGVSDFDRCRRELQSVGCEFGVCFDHTFSAMANYSKKTLKVGNAACFMTCMVETGECPGAIMVPSTRLRDAAHWVQQLSERPTFRPKAMWSDVHPHGMDFWRLFWRCIYGHLGIFHWTQRLTRTMRQRHPDYGKAVAALSDCVYFFYPPDEDAVQQALLSGTMNNDGPMNHDDIVILKREGTFKKCYSEYIWKVIYSASMI